MTPSKILILTALVLLLSGCTDPDRALRTLTEIGYSDIKLGGYGWFACSRGDTFATAFQAAGPSGKLVKGTVCNGLFKGATIRFD
jgi:hypothetical protein